MITKQVADPPPAVAPLSDFGSVFSLPTESRVTRMRLSTTEGRCRYGLSYRHHGVPASDDDFPPGDYFQPWGYAENPREDQCDALRDTSTRLPIMLRAAARMAGAEGPILVSRRVRGELLAPYLEVLASVAPDADEAQITRAAFESGRFAMYTPLFQRLGYRLRAVRFWRFERKAKLDRVSEAKRVSLGLRTPVRVPVLVLFELERVGPLPVLRGDVHDGSKTFGKLFALRFPVELSEVTARVGGKLTHVHLSKHTFRLSDACAEGRSFDGASQLIRALTELSGRSDATRLDMGLSFGRCLPVMKRWATVLQSEAWRRRKRPTSQAKTYELIRRLMFDQGVFAIFDPLFAAMGFRLADVHIEKVNFQRAMDHQHYPALEKLDIPRTMRFPVPLMTRLELERGTSAL